MSFYQKLKQRNVIRVAVAYGIAAWLLIQITATTFPVLNIPAWAVSLVTALILIGFPLALIFAWAFELTPEGVRLEEDMKGSGVARLFTGRSLDFIIIGLLVITVIYLLAKQPENPLETDAAFESPGAAEPAPTPGSDGWENSIAVLPFVNMSSDPEQEYFSDGLSEELLNLLAKIPSLKVIGRTSSFAFKGKDEDLRTIGENLGVSTLLEGSVRKSGERVRITAQLIDTSDGAHLWSETYDRTMTDIFTVQDEVAAAIINALHLHVGSAPKRGRPTENPEAYTLFLKAKLLLGIHDGPGATPLLEQAISLDPNFVEAHELHAFSYWSRGGSDIPVEEAFALSREAAAVALRINPDLPFAQALYVLPAGGGGPRLEALAALERAWRENPFNSAPLRVLIYELHVAGYHQEAYRYAQEWVDREPITPMANFSLGEALFAMGQFEEA
jgi:TolB-like protein